MGARIRFEDLPLHLQRQVAPQLADKQSPATPAKPMPVALTATKQASAQPKRTKRSPQPNKTEQRYRDQMLTSCVSVRFQPLRLYLSNGHSYRPDWGTVDDNGTLTLHEVKGPYIHSRDSRILFDTAVKEFPFFRFVWAQWKDNLWNIEEASI